MGRYFNPPVGELENTPFYSKGKRREVIQWANALTLTR